MRNPFKRRPEPTEVQPEQPDYVDLDRDVVPLHGEDVTARFFMLVMNHGPALMNETDHGWSLQIADRTFSGATQSEAVEQAEKELT